MQEKFCGQKKPTNVSSKQAPTDTYSDTRHSTKCIIGNCIRQK